jgi:NAD(P)-dependent dehydrogenase (short-subunit alcohol dehydrogenase family)
MVIRNNIKVRRRRSIMRMKQKVVIVTGGGKGLGKAISLAFAAEGATVVIAARDLACMEQTAREIKSGGGTADALVTDVRYEEQVKHMVSHTLDRFGRIDILVNNSALGGPTVNVIDMDLKDWNEVVATNLTGPMLCAREVLKPMIAARKGSIVTISSEGGRSGFAMRSPYAVSKRGVIALTETLAIEVGEYGIRVNCISPGRIRGERVENVARDKAKALGLTYDVVIGTMTADCSLGRFVEPAEVAAAAVFLASDEASAITGETLVVSCGKHMLH